MPGPIRRFALPIALVTALSACGGGGGGGGVVEVPFSSFQAIQPNQRVVMTGMSETVTGTVNAFGNVPVGSISPGALDEASSTVKLTYGGARNLSRIDISTPTTGLSLGAVNCSGGVCTAENATAVAIVIDATHPAFNWNYQSYGVWLNETTATTFQAGAMSAGAVTPGGAVPLAGNANFNGLTSAFYVDAGGTPFFTSAVMNAAVDFGAQSVVFTSTNTTAGNLVTGAAPITRNDLNLSGTMTYTPGINRFTGTISTTLDPAFLSGQGTGRFYGPAAQEMGGTYNLSGTGGRMLGAFGGRQP